MASIEFNDVELQYPIRGNHGMTLKELVLSKVLRKPVTAPTFIKAINGVSFRIGEGERVGIIGCNGAGKSSLLRTVAGIYPIAAGRRRVKGSIWSLFDISLGFEYDATGRENIYFRSYLQGDTPRTVREKVQEIGEFSELGKFFDLPIRCYSTGMITRLAFSIATSSHPEILLIDEVFATGDLAFQKKAEARMRDFIDRAKIVVMVGHQLEFLSEFCTRVIWMDKGRLHADGPAAEIIGRYMRDAGGQAKAA
jgi:lipopolysaccharide transport system ATP-binding protein